MTNGRGMMRFSRGFMRFGRGLPIVPCALRVQTAFDIQTHALTSRWGSVQQSQFMLQVEPSAPTATMAHTSLSPASGELHLSADFVALHLACNVTGRSL